jgi:hypothetical protein
MYRDQEPEFEMFTPSSRSSQSTPVPEISKLGKAFVDSLNARQLSEFLIWMLYHEVVELPDHPDVWYSLVDPADMRGWVALGNFLSKFSTTMDTGYGFDIVVMDSICDRLDLQRSTVHGLLVHFADPGKMAFSQIATRVNVANAEKLPEIEVLEIAQSKLREYSKLVAHLTPAEGSIYSNWRNIILKRLHSISNLVITPRIASLCYGAPLLTAATSENIPQEAKDGIRLKYLFELVQQKRQVPLSRYGIYQDPPSLGLMTPPSSSPDVRNSFVPDLEDVERVRNHAIMLMAQNHELRAQVAFLEQDKEKLQNSNEKLARKVAALSQNQQPSTYLQSPTVNNTPRTPTTHPSSPLSAHHQDPNYLQVPNPRTPHPRSRPRSLSQDTGTALATALSQTLNSATNHTRQRSEVLSWKYEDVFERLDTPPSPPIHLSDPATGEVLQPTEVGRRSGAVFSKDQMGWLRAIRGGTPSPPVGDEEEGRVETPTPGKRMRMFVHSK